MKRLIFLVALSLLLIGCTPAQCPVCPAVTCPVCKVEVIQPNQPTPLFMYIIDVGEGNSILLKQGETEMLLDCGRNSAGSTVVDFLKEKKVNDIEYLLITHSDSDHLGGCDNVLDSFKVHTVITNGVSSDTISYLDVMKRIDTETLITANAGNAWNIGTSTLRIVQSNNGLNDDNLNSIVAKLTYGPTDVLLTGDCDNKCEELLQSKDIQSDILVIPHHGSKYGTSLAFLQTVKPQISIISVGPNSYGHPAPETLDRIKEQGSTIYRTDNGDITVKIDDKSYEVV